MASRVERRLGQAFLAALALGAAYLLARLLEPVLAPLGAAAFAAVALFPAHRRLAARLGASAGLSAAVSAGVVTLGLALPLAGALWIGASEAAPGLAAAREALRAAAEGGALPLPRWAGGWPWPQLADALGGGGADAVGPVVARSLGAFARGLRSVVSFAVVFPTALYLLFRHGERALARLLGLLPLEEGLKSAVAADVGAAVGATVQALLAVAVVQGALAMAGFFLFGVRFAVLLGLLCGALSPLPFVGSALVWGPVVARLALDGEMSRALGLLAWCGVLVGLSDNLVRPFILRARTTVPLPLLVVALAAGLQAFGLAGAFVGPVAAAFFLSAARALRAAPEG